MITPAQFADAVLRPDRERDVELRVLLEHAREGHKQEWRTTRDVGMSNDGWGYLLVVTCSCQAEFYVARVSDDPPVVVETVDLELTWPEVLRSIGTEVWKLAPESYREAAHADIKFMACVQEIMDAIHVGVLNAAEITDNNDDDDDDDSDEEDR